MDLLTGDARSQPFDPSDPGAGQPPPSRGREQDDSSDLKPPLEPMPGPVDLVPGWLVNLAALAWRVLVVAGLAIVLWLIASWLWTVTASIAVAIVVSAVFAPLVLRLRARGRSRNAAAGIVWATAILTIAVVLLVLGLAFVPYVSQLATRIGAGLDELSAQLATLQVPTSIAALSAEAADALRGIAGDTVAGLVGSAASAVTILILASFLVFFFLRDGDKAWLWLFQSLGEQKREHITAAGDDALARVGGYLRGTTVLSATIAVTDLIFMWILGVPLALPLALFAFFAGYIPYFGGIVASGAILIVSLAAIGAGPTVLLLLLMAVRGLAVGYLLRPNVYGRSVDIHPALVLLALPAGYQLAGMVGLFAAVPVTAVVLAVAGAAVTIIEPVPPPPLPGLVPAWLDRLAQLGWRMLVGIALVALLVLVLVTVPIVVFPVILALIIAATLDPFVERLVRGGRSRGRAAAVTVGGAFLVVAAVMSLTLASLSGQAGAVGDTVVRGVESASAAVGGQLELGVQAVRSGTIQTVRAVLSVLDAAASVATITILGTLLAFYGLRDGPRLWGRVVAHVDPSARPAVDGAASRAFDVLGGYMVGTAAISLVGAASQLVIMVILGLPLAMPVFVLSFLLGFIPYIGGFISTGIAFLIAVATGSASDVLVMAIWTLVFNIVQGNLVSPIVYGRTVHIHPAIVLVAIPAGSAVAGILGMFVVVPAIGIVATTWRTVLALLGGSAQPGQGSTTAEVSALRASGSGVVAVAGPGTEAGPQMST